jgi:hypothetical protein
LEWGAALVAAALLVGLCRSDAALAQASTDDSILVDLGTTPGIQGGVWHRLLPFLPAPGEFAVISRSALTPVLVRGGEFEFCDQIKCDASAAVLESWNGAAFDARRGEFRVHGGGASDYGGNEVYVFDFATLKWSRETEPQPLTGPFQRDTDGDGVPNACPSPALGPPATHTHQGFLYVPKIDRYWLFGSAGYCSNGSGNSVAWDYDARRGTWTAMPDLAQFAEFASAVVDPRSGHVLVHAGHAGGWHEVDPVTRQVVNSFEGGSFSGDGSVVFDSRRGVVFALASGDDSDRLLAYQWPGNGTSKDSKGRVIAEWPKGARQGWGMAQNDLGLLVLWDGEAQIVVVDPDIGKSWKAEARGYLRDAMVAQGDARRVYSKWRYIPESDVFFGITDPDLGVVLYRLGGPLNDDPQLVSGGTLASASDADNDSASAPLTNKPTPSGSPVTPVQYKPAAASEDQGQAAPREVETIATWQEVCATAVLCDPMGDGDVIYRQQVFEHGPPILMEKNWRSIAQKFTHPEAKAPTPDPEIGGLRFTFPSNSGSGIAGNFKTNFSPDSSFQIGPAEAGAPAQEAYIQFQVRYSCTFIWTDCDPNSPNYRKERRCFLSKGSEDTCTLSKIALIATGDRKGVRAADACTRIQTAINHAPDHTLYGFHRCPRAYGFDENLGKVGGRVQLNSQPNGEYYCPRILADGSRSDWNHTADTCFRLIDDRWITIQIHLRFGPWQSSKEQNQDGPKKSHVSIWAAIEGQDGGRQKLVIDNDFAASVPENPQDFVGKIWLMPHLYNKSAEETHPPFYVWYRNLVISESLIPNPS